MRASKVCLSYISVSRMSASSALNEKMRMTFSTHSEIHTKSENVDRFCFAVPPSCRRTVSLSLRPIPSSVMSFWKPGTIAPGSTVDREGASDELLQYNPFEGLTIQQQRMRLPIFRNSSSCCAGTMIHRLTVAHRKSYLVSSGKLLHYCCSGPDGKRKDHT